MTVINFRGSEAVTSLSTLSERNRAIGELYLLEREILQSVQNEHSEAAAEGVRSLIRYFKSV